MSSTFLEGNNHIITQPVKGLQDRIFHYCWSHYILASMFIQSEPLTASMANTYRLRVKLYISVHIYIVRALYSI
jgi:hypothetical protein